LPRLFPLGEHKPSAARPSRITVARSGCRFMRQSLIPTGKVL
jgi:hypothetical protein